ncbi:hypothetical protein RchiOBHm_Chr2g0141511 [Rosa chinensis]|uniref:Uncharacterized protein n=1 Tax=Rosa chinensis TaxID=74649 RepID=A0A2P6RXK7_ROSCH|nr:hypothetical protein RchiOBHm_Chr2g0141511 [Rosa chinensis]
MTTMGVYVRDLLFGQLRFWFDFGKLQIGGLRIGGSGVVIFWCSSSKFELQGWA